MKIKASHILVKHQYEADDIFRLLKQGKPFAELAKKYSICSSGPGGGSLGEIEESRLDSDFVSAFFSLNADQISQPIRTRFGWHLIKR